MQMLWTTSRRCASCTRVILGFIHLRISGCGLKRRGTSMGRNGKQSWDVTLIGSRPCMLDRYAGSKTTQLTPVQKLYFSSDGSQTLVLPNLNLVSLLSALNTDSAPKRL